MVVAFSIKPEHVIIKDNKKYVAYVNSFLHVNVNYYDYINGFLVGNRIKISEYYGKGGYDPFDELHNENKAKNITYYDEEGRVIKDNTENNAKIYVQENNSTNTTEIYNIDNNKTNQTDVNSETEILYYKEINQSVRFKIVNQGNWSGRHIIQIFKSTNAGKSWSSQLKTSDGTMDVHYNTKYTFIDENLGYINDPGREVTDGMNSSFMITTDGGKHFNEVTIISTNEINGRLYCEDVAVLEDGKLKLKVYITENGIKTYYNFVNKGEADFEFVYEK